MISLSPRRLVPACALTAALAALAAPGAAQAFPGTQCSGESIVGEGSSAQKLANIETWNLQFVSGSNGNSLSCNGTNGDGKQPTITYTSIGSGEGMEKWGFEHHTVETGRVSFVGTDEPPNPAAKAEIEEAADKEGSGKKNQVFTEPITQFAVAIDIHLPAGCTATNEVTKKHLEGRLVLNNTTLEGIFQGEITKWGQITDGKDKFSSAACENEEIQRVVRFDESGTTHVFKRYLYLINPGSFPTEKAGSEDWSDMSEPKGNQNWPVGKGKPTVNAGANGGGELVKYVATHPSTIGYAALSDSRKNKNFDGEEPGTGIGTERFWAEIQSNGTGAKGKYLDPSTNGDAPKGPTSNSNCGKVKYTNGKGKKFPPKSTTEAWNEVTTSTKQPTYPICGLTYDLLLKEYSKAPGATEGQAQTVRDYFNFVFSESPEGGQALIENKDYYRLPSKLIAESAKGLSQVKF
jgi:ABC-type phosphate transport system substrate-binding protein